jgi:hypothetical protein
MKAKSFYTYFLCLLSTFSVEAQQLDPTKIPDIIPPSPNAAELGRYGNMNIGLITGSANVSIPLLTLENGLVPVSIAYNTTGIKVDQIATRAGLGWILNAGGVITRTMISKQDEISTRLNPDFSQFNETLYKNLQDIVHPSLLKETEPDIFAYNFEGNSGKFVLDATNKVVQLQAKNLKIDFTNIGQASSTFTITTSDGTKYIFQTIELTRSYSQIYGNPLEPTSLLVPTAWYLTKIVLTNSEEITFNYANDILDYPVGVSEVFKNPIRPADQCALNGCSSLPTTTLTRNAVYAQSKRLTSISYKKSAVIFTYADRTDIIGDKLISSIQLKNNNSLIKQFDLIYAYALSSMSANYYFQIPELRKRPFLQALIEKGSNGIEVRKHQFTYNDINGLPHRLSFSQDIYGYYNGKTNSSHFVPIPQDIQDQADFPLATADRDPDFNYAAKGALTSVKYPTGGKDSIIYEANMAMTSKDMPETYSTVSATIQGTPTPDWYATAASSPFIIHDSLIAYVNKVYLSGGIMAMSSTDDPPSSAEDFMQVEIKKSSDNSTVWGRKFKYGENTNNEIINVLSAGVYYYIKITVLQTNSGVRRYHANLKYVSKGPYITYEPGITGGIRVQRILTSDNLGNTQIKRYYYTYLNNLSKSSGWVRKPTFKIDEEICTVTQCGPATFPTMIYCKSRYMFSSSLINLFIFGQHHVNYDNVIESIGGDNYEAGGIEHAYHVVPEGLGKPVIGQYFILGTKNSYTAHLHGLEKSTRYFKKTGNDIITVKYESHSYKIDTSLGKDIIAYEVRKRYDHPLNHLLLTGYDVQRYFYQSRWTIRTSTKSVEYNNNGSDSMITVQNFSYNNPYHKQLTEINTINSQLDDIKIVKKYPHDLITLNRDPYGYYQQMVSKNIVSPVIEEIHSVKNSQIKKIITNYYNPYPNFYLPRTVEIQRKKTDPLETRLNFVSYDNKANIAAIVKDDGPIMSYLWGYQQTYPIASCTNADIAQITYSSFEPDASGNWNGIITGNISSNYSVTGSTSYLQTGFSLSRPGMTAGTGYFVSYWTRNTSAYSVAGTQTGYPKKGRTVNGWTYYEHLVFGVTTITVSGSGYIDELRAYPKNAQMSTFTYDPFKGKTSECDPNNIITYYEYDNFQRLTLVRDMDKNIIRKICYDYAGSPSSCN